MKRRPLSGDPWDWVHPRCRAALHLLKEPRCLHCGKELQEEQEYCADCQKHEHHFRRNYTLLSYNAAARESISRFKYRGRQQYARFYAGILAEGLGAEVRLLKPEVLVPVPIFRDRLRKRGYNQAELLARELGRLLDIPVDASLVRRCKKTRAMKQLSPPQRIRNLADALMVSSQKAIPKRVLLVDDIYTTGSTLEALSRVLLQAGCQEIYALTLCVGMAD